MCFLKLDCQTKKRERENLLFKSGKDETILVSSVGRCC